VGQAHRPTGLPTDWLLSQLGNQYAKAVADYVDYVEPGMGLPSEKWGQVSILFS
jgi:hypothetical protein